MMPNKSYCSRDWLIDDDYTNNLDLIEEITREVRVDHVDNHFFEKLMALEESKESFSMFPNNCKQNGYRS